MYVENSTKKAKKREKVNWSAPYCTILIDLSHLCDRDRPAEIFILAAHQVTHDMTKILAGLGRIWNY
jgi:hypothetical protein